MLIGTYKYRLMDRDTINKIFSTHFGNPSITIHAPGRINLIGEHTDYNHGLVLPAAIDSCLYFALSKNEKEPEEVVIYSADYDQLSSFSLAAGAEQKIEGWLRYLEAIALVLKERGYQLEGYQCAFGGDIPIGAGLSSSAALTCGLIRGLSELHQWDLPKEEIALIAQAAEHRVGILCGLMDQYAVLFGQKGKVIQLDCRDLKVDYFPCELGNHCLLLFNTKVEHSLAATAYNDRRASCERILQQVQEKYSTEKIETLRDIKSSMLENNAALDAMDVQRVRFVLAENERVVQTTKALQAGELQEVGQLLYQSHEGLSKVYEVSCEELDVLVDLAKKEKDILGARMMGGGFGGCTINLVKQEVVKKVKAKILAAYFEKTGIQGEAYVVNIGDGVGTFSVAEL